MIYGNALADENRLAQWHNFLRLSGGTLDFGKLTMHHVDLTMIDASQDPWFDLDLVNYQAQLVNGYTRMTAQAGLEIFMPDLDEQAPKKASQSITVEWLKDRSRSLPLDVPVMQVGARLANRLAPDANMVDEPISGSSTKERRLLVVGPVRRIIGGFNFREPLHADGVDLGDPVLEAGAFDLILYRAIPENAFRWQRAAPSGEFWRTLERFLQAKTRCHSVRFSYSPLSFFQLSWVAMLRM